MVQTSTGSCALRSPQRDLASDRALLAESRIFEESGYVARVGEEARPDPILHYLEAGWRLGLEPNGSFPGSLLQPYFDALTTSQPPAITWLLLRSAGWPMPASREQIEHQAASVRDSGLFDESYYLSQLGPAASGLDPATHYVIVGERMGLAPSPEFDPAYYAARNPDVVEAAMSYLFHYCRHGRAEGRMAKPADVRGLGRAQFDPTKENVLLVIHETSRTGAPILGWNLARILARRFNVFTVRLGEGEIEQRFFDVSVESHGPFLGYRRNTVDLEYALRELLTSRKFAFAIVNSAESRIMVEPCVKQFVPTLLLIHEFAAYVNPVSSLNSALDWSTEVVFSAPMVKRAAEQAHPNLAARAVHILPQGVTQLPPDESKRSQDEANRTLQDLAAKRTRQGTFIVLGVGFVHFRKGVDLFLSAAAAVLRSEPRCPFHFLWVGDGYDPKKDMHYSVYLQEQLSRSGLAEHVTFLGVVSDVEPAYRIADAFLLSSRLDPLPNSAVDAAVAGIPVVCFQDASGIADLLLQNPDTALGVVDHLDCEAAAKVLVDLATDSDLYARISRPTRDLANTVFDLEAYCAKLEALGRSACAQMQQRALDAATLLNDPAFDQDMFLGPSRSHEPRKTTVARYLALGAARGWTQPPAPDPGLRRPSPGFNPRIYAAYPPEKLPQGADPLADFVRRGKPAGPWQTTVLRPIDPPAKLAPVGGWPAALHAHLFYPELCADFLAHLAANQSDCDLLISTDDASKAERLRRKLASYHRGKVTIRVVPNRGRDLGPLLTEFRGELNKYELVGHVHSKRSRWSGGKPADINWGDAWREFLWQNLIGGLHPMMDRIVAAFEHDDSLGLVFPSDPHLVGWDDNRELAADLAVRMGWLGPLPDHFDFPLGNMFWIRPAALRPFLDLDLDWGDFPEEPVPYDGTLLHALERLSPIACHVAGFQFAVTHVSGISWSPAEL